MAPTSPHHKSRSPSNGRANLSDQLWSRPCSRAAAHLSRAPATRNRNAGERGPGTAGPGHGPPRAGRRAPRLENLPKPSCPAVSSDGHRLRGQGGSRSRLYLRFAGQERLPGGTPPPPGTPRAGAWRLLTPAENLNLQIRVIKAGLAVHRKSHRNTAAPRAESRQACDSASAQQCPHLPRGSSDTQECGDRREGVCVP